MKDYDDWDGNKNNKYNEEVWNWNSDTKLTPNAYNPDNVDGYPDLVLCIYSGTDGEMGTIAGIVSAGKTSLTPADFPDIYSNSTLREGYKGHDAYTTLMGSLMQTFPIYKPGDTDTATGGTRVVQYTIAKGEKGNLTFKALRSYEKKD